MDTLTIGILFILFVLFLLLVAAFIWMLIDLVNDYLS